MVEMAARLQRESLMNAAGNEGKTRKSYTLDFKRQVINFYHAHAGNISLAAKMFGVDRKLVRSWVEQEDFFRQNRVTVNTAEADAVETLPTTSSAISLPASKVNKIPNTTVSVVMTTPGVQRSKRPEKTLAPNSVARYPELEKALSEWWLSQANRGQNIKVKILKSQALRLYRELYPYSSDQEFKASTGWLQRFITRMESGEAAHTNLVKARPVVQPEKPHPGNFRQEPGVPLRATTRVHQIAISPRVVPLTVTEQVGFNQGGHESVSAIVKNRLENTDAGNSTADSDAPVANYAFMTTQERAAMERQNQESNKFFHDIREFFTFLDRIDS